MLYGPTPTNPIIYNIFCGDPVKIISNYLSVQEVVNLTKALVRCKTVTRTKLLKLSDRVTFIQNFVKRQFTLSENAKKKEYDNFAEFKIREWMKNPLVKGVMVVISTGIILKILDEDLGSIRRKLPDCTYEQALLIACQTGNYDFACQILIRNAQALSREAQKKCFVEACSSGSESVVRLFFQQKIDTANNIHEGFKASCLKGHLHIVSILLDLKEIKKLIPRTLGEGFVEACKGGHFELVTSFDIFTFETKYFDDGFRAACEEGKIRIVKFLLESSLCRKDVRAARLLMMSTEVEILKYLQKTDKSTLKLAPLLFIQEGIIAAVTHVKNDIFRELIKLTEIITPDLYPAICYEACRTDNLEVAIYFLSTRNVDAGQSFKFACEGNAGQVVHYIVCNNLAPELINMYFLQACYNGCDKVVAQLLNHPKLFEDNVKHGFENCQSIAVLSILKDHKSIDATRINARFSKACKANDHKTVYGIIDHPDITSDTLLEGLFECCKDAFIYIAKKIASDPRLPEGTHITAFTRAYTNKSEKVTSMLTFFPSIPVSMVKQSYQTYPASVLFHPSITKQELRIAIVEAVKNGNLDNVSAIIHHPLCDSAIYKLGFLEACKINQDVVIKLMIANNMPFHRDQSQAFIEAFSTIELSVDILFNLDREVCFTVITLKKALARAALNGLYVNLQRLFHIAKQNSWAFLSDDTLHAYVFIKYCNKFSEMDEAKAEMYKPIFNLLLKFNQTADVIVKTFSKACEKGQLVLVTFFINNSNLIPAVAFNEGFLICCKHGHIKLARLFKGHQKLSIETVKKGHKFIPHVLN